MNKLLKIMLTSLISILLAGIIAYVVLMNLKSDPLEDLAKYSYETPEITTDLQDGSFVRIQFQIVTNGKDAFNEIAIREFQLKNILIKEIAKLDEKKFKSDLAELEKSIKNKMNELMIEGEIVDVYTISKILQ